MLTELVPHCQTLRVLIYVFAYSIGFGPSGAMNCGESCVHIVSVYLRSDRFTRNPAFLQLFAVTSGCHGPEALIYHDSK